MTAEVRDVIQITTARGDGLFYRCFAVVKEVHGWGVKAAVFGPGEDSPNEYPIRLGHDDYVVVGKEWSPR